MPFFDSVFTNKAHPQMFLNCLAIGGSNSAATGEEEVGDHLKHWIHESLEWIFEKSWQSEKVPKDWKEADGKPTIRGANQSRRKIQVTTGWSTTHLSLGRVQSKPSQKFIHVSGNDKMMECRAYQKQNTLDLLPSRKRCLALQTKKIH